MPTVGASVLAAAAAAAGFAPWAAAVVALEALAAAAWLAASAAFAASAVLFSDDRLSCVSVVVDAASASAAFFATVSAVPEAVVAVCSSFSPSLPLASPSIEPLASVLLLVEACSARPVSPLRPLVPVAALVALPTFAACAGTAPWAPLNAASAACSASLIDLASEWPTCLPCCAPSAVASVAPDVPAVASVSAVVASSVAVVLVPLAFVFAFALAWSWACACNWAATAAAAAEVVVLPELLALCWVEPLLLLPVPCCVLPDDEAEVVPLLPAALLLWLPAALLELLLLEVWLFDCADACALADAADADADGDGAGVGAGAGALGAAVLALCAALFCESMLCCKVCANGWALELSGVLLVGELSDEPNSELINDSGDMADPVYPVTRSICDQCPLERCCFDTRGLKPARGLNALSAHPENSCGVFIGVALFAPRKLLRFRCVATCL